MEWCDAHALSYLVIFIPLCLDLLARLTGRIKYIRVFQKFALSPMHTNANKIKCRRVSVLFRRVLYLIHEVIRRQNLNRKSIQSTAGSAYDLMRPQNHGITVLKENCRMQHIPFGGRSWICCIKAFGEKKVNRIV